MSVTTIKACEPCVDGVPAGPETPTGPGDVSGGFLGVANRRRTMVHQPPLRAFCHRFSYSDPGTGDVSHLHQIQAWQPKPRVELIGFKPTIPLVANEVLCRARRHNPASTGTT